MQLGLHPGPVALMEQSFMARVAKAQPSQQVAIGKQSRSNRLARQRFRCCTKVQESNIVLRKPRADLCCGDGPAGSALGGHGGMKMPATRCIWGPEQRTPRSAHQALAGVAGGSCDAP